MWAPYPSLCFLLFPIVIAINKSKLWPAPPKCYAGWHMPLNIPIVSLRHSTILDGFQKKYHMFKYHQTLHDVLARNLDRDIPLGLPVHESPMTASRPKGISKGISQLGAGLWRGTLGSCNHRPAGTLKTAENYRRSEGGFLFQWSNRENHSTFGFLNVSFRFRLIDFIDQNKG